MKNTLTLLLLLCTTWMWSQTIPNAGFENWTSCPYIYEPVPFQTSNAFSIAFSGALTVERSSDAHQGQYAAYLHADSNAGFDGILVQGINLMSGMNTPIPFSGAPDSIGFWAKYSLNTDIGSVIVTLFESGLEVGYGVITLGEVATEYTYYSAAFDITPGAVPDGVSVAISSGSSAAVDDYLYIDDVHLIYNTTTGDDISGGDFENWNITTEQCLDDWFATNGYTYPNISVTPGEPHSGNHSVRITNQVVQFDSISIGYILLGDPESELCSEPSLHMPSGQAVTSLSGYYKYTAGNANEMATIFLYYSAVNDLGNCDSIYSSYQYLPAVSDWTPFNFDVPQTVIDQWQTGIQPEYLTVGFVSTIVSDTSDPNGDPNSVLLVDDLEVTYSTVGLEEFDLTSVTAYPNPFNDELTIQMSVRTQAEIKLIDAIGEIALSTQVNGEKTTLQTHALPSGIYTLYVNNGISITTQHVILQH